MSLGAGGIAGLSWFWSSPWQFGWLLAWALLYWWVQSSRPAAILFSPASQLAKALQAAGSSTGFWSSKRRQRLPFVLQWLGLGFLIVALARPVLRVQEHQEYEGIDLVLCMDLSSSMSTRDAASKESRDSGLEDIPMRLELSREAAIRFVKARSRDRLGLLAFARFPDLRCPLTRDQNALVKFIEDLQPLDQKSPEDATGIGAALARSAQALSAGTSPSRVIILLTDGEENVATAETPDEIAPLHAAQLCRQLGIRVYCIAVGGKVALESRDAPDHSQIKNVAQKSGGEFFEAGDLKALNRAYSAIDELERGRSLDPRYRFREVFVPFLALGLMLIGLGKLLGLTRLRVSP